MTKADRQKIFDKYGGKCAYCGCELVKGWHVDEVKPVLRNFKRVGGVFKNDKYIQPKLVHDGSYVNPENLHIDNQNPSCASCNINKHSMSLEQFREFIAHFIISLNRDSTQYKIAKRYGLIAEINKPVLFYFETLKSAP